MLHISRRRDNNLLAVCHGRNAASVVQSKRGSRPGILAWGSQPTSHRRDGRVAGRNCRSGGERCRAGTETSREVILQLMEKADTTSDGGAESPILDRMFSFANSIAC